MGHISGHKKERNVTRNGNLEFIKDKSCLISLTAFYEKMSDLWSRIMVDFIHKDFSKGCDTIRHNVFMHKLGPKGQCKNLIVC